MLNTLILALEHRYIGLIISASIIVVAVIAIIIRYLKRTKVDETNVDTVYPLKAPIDSAKKDNEESNLDSKEIKEEKKDL